jgi:hypothetical protein
LAVLTVCGGYAFRFYRLECALRTRTTTSAPDGDWYKDFRSFILCGTGNLPKTVLEKGMRPFGVPIE